MARKLRAELRLISSLIPAGAKVLDIGCGDGALLAELRRRKQVVGQGIELSGEGVRRGLLQGLSVIQGDADTDLYDYPAASFDYVVLSQTIHATRNPARVLENLVRIGKFAVVSFHNFGHWRIRLKLLFFGRMPITADLPYSWHDTPNIHLCTIADFRRLCRSRGINIHKVMIPKGRWKGRLSNLFDKTAVFLIAEKSPTAKTRKASGRRKYKSSALA